MIEISPGLWQIDTLLGGQPEITAAYLITGEKPLLIETGSATSAPVVIDALNKFGLTKNDLASIAVTHIHVDHAGGVAEVASAFPKATIYVHEKGARHLAEPSRLMDSAERVFGELLDNLFGRMTDISADRIEAVGDEDAIDIDDTRAVEVINTPGHAKHHLSFFDHVSSTLFCGDSLGVLLPNMPRIRPSAPPPDFDIALAEDSMEKMRSFDPTFIAFPHFGVYRTGSIFDDAKAQLARWVDVAHFALSAGDDVVSVFEREFPYADDGVSTEIAETLEKLNGFKANADGITRYWSTVGVTSDGAN